MFDWLDKDVAWGLGLASLAMFLASPVIVGVLLVRMPADYFVRERRLAPASDGVAAGRIALRVLKNLLGALLIVAGLAMLALPGQGVLTLLVGVALVDVPGKRKLEERMVGSPKVSAAINKLRTRFGREPLRLPEES